LKKWKCIQEKNHKNIGEIIEVQQQNGWHLHTYACSQISVGADAMHYLLFEKGG